MSPTRVRAAALDDACVAAVDLARRTAEDLAGPGSVGEHVGVQADDERVVTHLFACRDLAYTGWRWAVTVARASRAKAVTVDEVVLLPGPDSLLAPDWVPWSERVRPGDLGVGDLMPTASDDERLVPISMLEGDEGLLDWDDTGTWAALSGLAAASGLAVDAGGTASGGRIAGGTASGGRIAGAAAGHAAGAGDGDGAGAGGTGAGGAGAAAAAESWPAAGAGPGSLAAAAASGGRTRVLSAIGRDTTALRWYSSEHGPSTPLARAAPGPCVTCGFLTPLAGPLGRIFGVCANEYAPDDGRVVSLDHGCGAHSEAATTRAGLGAVTPVIDEVGYDLVDSPGVAMEDTVFESLDHDS